MKSNSPKTVVIAAGPAFKQSMRKNLEEIMQHREDVTIVACDGAMPTLATFDCVPDFVVSVDPQEIIADFYKKSRNILNNNVTAILATSTDPHVVEECIRAGVKIKWIQPFFKNNDDEPYFREGVTSMEMGGNVGTSCYLLSCFALKSKPIGLLGIEFSWSDDTPYSDTEFYEELSDALDNDSNKVEKQFLHQVNPRDGKTYIADPVYYAYFLMLKEIWEQLPLEIKKNSFNLTSQGILTLDGLNNITPKQFLEILI